MKIITQQVDQAAERHLSDGNVATENFTAGPDQTDLSEGSALPAKALPAKLAFQPAEERADASAAAATPDGALIQAPENQSEENMFVIRPRPAERRAEDFMRDWMRRFTRS